MFTFAATIGFLTIALSLLVKVIGFPDQIRKNHKRKSTEGLSAAFFVLSFFVYVLWTIHGIIKKDMVVILGQGLGIITTGVIVFQIFLYGKKK